MTASTINLFELNPHLWEKELIFRKSLEKVFFDNDYALKKMQFFFFLSLLIFDIPPKISILYKTNFPFFESFTLTTSRAVEDKY